ncbi:GNAT family N-acetyltransferase [Brochothrix campestris]|uniref:GNAT family N-acetyltransferase n=1 Tax=Brochothrix campestris TaxID=2757 RepID=UPI0038D0857F
MIIPLLSTSIITERLLLAPLIPADNDELYTLWSNLETTRYLHSPKLTAPTMVAAVVEAIAADPYFQRFSLRTLTDYTLIGTVGINDCTAKGIEIGFELLPRYKRQGYMSEALTAFLYNIWNQTDADIYAKVDTANYASLKLLESLQANRVFSTKEYCVEREETVDLYYYILEKKNFLTKF